jgi:tetratricopeptide (TPR) repeat protein
MGTRAIEHNLLGFLINSIERITIPKSNWEVINRDIDKSYLTTALEHRKNSKPIKFNKYFSNFLSYDSFLLKQNRESDSIKQLERMKLKVGISRYEKAIILGRLANRYSNLNLFKKVEDAYSQQLIIYKELLQHNPDRYISEMALTLFNIAFLYADTGRRKKAEKAYDEALILYTKLIEREPNRYGIDYANTIIFAYYATGKYQDSLEPVKKLLQTYTAHPRAKMLLEFMEEIMKKN